jgi:hypothetical protein
VTTTSVDLNRNDDEGVRVLIFIPSRSPILANKNPQNAAVDKLAKTNQLSTALDEIVATPPSKKLVEVTMNSAKKLTPPEEPMT